MKFIGVKYGKQSQTLSTSSHPLTMVGHFGNSVGKNCYPVSHIEMLKKKSAVQSQWTQRNLIFQ
jgi:hypothetical protein